MSTSVIEELKGLASVDLFDEVTRKEGFIGHPFYFDFESLRVLSNDSWKSAVGGVPANAFVLCHYTGSEKVDEVVLARVIRPTKLPTDDDVIAAMVDFYKEPAVGTLDSYTRSEFQFSGLECRVLGTFYRDGDGKTSFAGDIDNFFSANNYRVVKPTGQLLEYVVNFRDGGIPGGKGDQRLGTVRYSSSRRMEQPEDVPVYVSAFDFLGKRTALFGMTRTGKSNSVKKVIQATSSLSSSGATLDGSVVEPVGQLIFDVNGEYANDNQQDEGTALYKQYDDVERYSVMEKEGFKVMKLNFFESLVEGFGILGSLLRDDITIYTNAFLNVDWSEPDVADKSATTRYERRVAAYKAILHAAGFASSGLQVKFAVNKEIRESGIPGLNGVDPAQGLSLDEAIAWFTAMWRNYDDPSGPFASYAQANGREWADEDLKSLVRFLTRASKPGATPTEAGFRKLVPHRDLHTPTTGASFEDEIVGYLRDGKIVILDLSQGDPEIQRMYSDRVCKRVFADAMAKFIANEHPNFIQLYFEEAHNLFPRKDERDLTLIYNRLAKEGQKLRLGLCYATQEVSSISSSILKNTQNWFVSHLNNRDELREIDKYYDFEDFSESLRRTTDRGFIRLKTDSNTFIVPIQVDKFKVSARDEPTDASAAPPELAQADPAEIG